MKKLLPSLQNIFRWSVGIKNKLLAVIIFLAGMQFISSAQTGQFSVVPANTNIAPNTPFTVTIRVDLAGGGDMAGAEFHLFYNTAILQVTNITDVSGGVLPFAGVIPFPTVANSNTAGQVQYAASTATAFGTSFNWFTVTFISIPSVTGVTPLTYSTTAPITRVAGGTAVNQPPVDGTVTFTAGSCTLTDAVIANSSNCIGQGFNLSLQSTTGGTGPFDLVVNGVPYNGIAVGQTFASASIPAQTAFTTQIPAGSATNPFPGGIELGVKFKSDVAGYVRGVRFYSPPDVSGTFTGNLYDEFSNPLATAAYTGVVANTWNQVLFAAPVLISANTIYIASYHSSNASYQATAGGIATDIVNGHLTVPADGPFPDGNGVYHDVPAGSNTFGAGFPDVANGAAVNYFADVIFTPQDSVFNLTSVTDAGGCILSGTPIQALTVSQVPCATLPVTLMNFSATPQNKDVVLNWATASEINNKGYEIQRSADNRTWEGIAFVNGAGNSSVTKNYSYTDKNLFPRRYFYRLRQFDIDDNFKLSAVVSATIDGKAEFVLGQNYPNPFKGPSVIQYTVPVVSRVNLTLFDMHGRAMQVLVNGTKEAGSHAVYVYSNLLPPGVYYYRLQAGNFTSVKKLVVQ